MERRADHPIRDWRFGLCSRQNSQIRRTHIAKILSREASQEASLVFQRQAVLAQHFQTLAASQLEAANPVLVFQWLGGLPIDQWLANQPLILNRHLWFSIARELLRQLDQLHRLGYVHTSLIPEHVWVDADQQPHLLGLGHCRPVGEALVPAARFAPYDAPECSIPGCEASSASDIYSLAILLDKLVSGAFAATPVGRCMLAQWPGDRPTAGELLELFACYARELSWDRAFAA